MNHHSTPSFPLIELEDTTYRDPIEYLHEGFERTLESIKSRRSGRGYIFVLNNIFEGYEEDIIKGYGKEEIDIGNPLIYLDISIDELEEDCIGLIEKKIYKTILKDLIRRKAEEITDYLSFEDIDGTATKIEHRGILKHRYDRHHKREQNQGFTEGYTERDLIFDTEGIAKEHQKIPILSKEYAGYIKNDLERKNYTIPSYTLCLKISSEAITYATIDSDIQLKEPEATSLERLARTADYGAELGLCKEFISPAHNIIVITSKAFDLWRKHAAQGIRPFDYNHNVTQTYNLSEDCNPQILRKYLESLEQKNMTQKTDRSESKSRIIDG